MATHDQEELLNGKLAELLRGQGLDARAERRESGRRMDIVVDLGGAHALGAPQSRPLVRTGRLTSLKPAGDPCRGPSAQERTER